jgi:kumamolisin
VVVEKNEARRSVVLSGSAGNFSTAFGTTLSQFERPEGTYRGRTGGLTAPSSVSDIIEGVFGLDDRPQASPHYQQTHAATASALKPLAAANGSFTPPQLASLYNFPTGLDGSGQTVAIIELGGGYRPADLKTYFAKLGVPTPKVKAVRVDGGRNHPSNANSADGEVMLDIDVAGSIAPKASIVVYFAPNTSQGFLDAITTAMHDNVNKPSVISISWGGPESSWTGQSMTQFDQAFQAAAALGVTVCAAAGDNGSGDGVTDGKSHVDFPASSPYALACGGTKLLANGAKIASETVWNESPNSATGGGVSATFPLPTYQAAAHVPPSTNPGGGTGRGVPDVSGDADPASGYQVRVDGQDLVFGGTSAVAPLWAGLIALMNQKLPHPTGFLNPLIYGSLAGKGGFSDITTGNNGAYQAGVGWDACSGWGSPNGAGLLGLLNH